MKKSKNNQSVKGTRTQPAEARSEPEHVTVHRFPIESSDRKARWRVSLLCSAVDNLNIYILCILNTPGIPGVLIIHRGDPSWAHGIPRGTEGSHGEPLGSVLGLPGLPLGIPRMHPIGSPWDPRGALGPSHRIPLDPLGGPWTPPGAHWGDPGGPRG